MHSWLESFPYRTAISWWIIIAAGCAAVAIAVGTVGFLAVRAARANPVTSLRNE
jgi:putative ABC transport system permease protein